MKLKVGDLVAVKWLDSQASTGFWENRDGMESMKPLICTSVVWITGVSKKYIKLAHNQNQ